MCMYFWFFLLLFLLFFVQEYGEFDFNWGNGIFVDFIYGYYMFGGDFGKCFGNYFSVGIGVEFIIDKGNWFFGLGMSYYFGNEVVENLFIGLFNDQGCIIGNNCGYVDIQFRMCGYYVGGYVGKFILLGFFKNLCFGLRVIVSMGLLQYKI